MDRWLTVHDAIGSLTERKLSKGMKQSKSTPYSTVVVWFIFSVPSNRQNTLTMRLSWHVMMPFYQTDNQRAIRRHAMTLALYELLSKPCLFEPLHNSQRVLLRRWCHMQELCVVGLLLLFVYLHPKTKLNGPGDAIASAIRQFILYNYVAMLPSCMASQTEVFGWRLSRSQHKTSIIDQRNKQIIKFVELLY